MIPGLGRSPGEGKGYPVQYLGLENSMGCIVHGIAKSQTQLNDFHFSLFFSLLRECLTVSFEVDLYSDLVPSWHAPHMPGGRMSL